MENNSRELDRPIEQIHQLADLGDKEINVENQKYRTAGFWVRFFAYSIDLISVSAIGAILIGMVHRFVEVPVTGINWVTMSAATIGVVGFVYFAIMTRLWKQTVGKMISGIQVIRKDGKDLDWVTVVIREVVGRTISQLFGSHIGYIWIAFHPCKQGWHDMFSDTYVVHVNELEGRRWIRIQK